MPELTHADILIEGEVQGVFFRAFTVRIAKSLNLRGYVRNIAHGSVEVVAEGYKDKLEELINKLHSGPPESLVENVDVKWSDYTGQFGNFEIK